jgi:hypothetical protein
MKRLLLEGDVRRGRGEGCTELLRLYDAEVDHRVPVTAMTLASSQALEGGALTAETFKRQHSGQIAPIDLITSSIAAMHASAVTPGNGFRHASSLARFQASDRTALHDRALLDQGAERPALQRAIRRGGWLGRAACVADWKTVVASRINSAPQV